MMIGIAVIFAMLHSYAGLHFRVCGAVIGQQGCRVGGRFPRSAGFGLESESLF